MRLSTACASAIFMSEGATSLKVVLEHLQRPCHHMSVAALQLREPAIQRWLEVYR